MKLCSNSIIAAALMIALPLQAIATERPQSHKGDGRILHLHYDEGEVYQIDVNFRYITMIQFEQGEVVNAIQIGDSESFQVSRLNRGDMITIKPLIENARTNMNIVTSKRIYTFYINAISGGRTEGQNFRIYFKYGNEGHKETFESQTSGTKASGEMLNTNYLISGKADFVPVQVYDDGVNTWVRYTSTARRPAIFQTNEKGEESVINYTAHPNHLVQLHGLSENWTLRIGDEIVCLKRDDGRRVEEEQDDK